MQLHGYMATLQLFHDGKLSDAKPSAAVGQQPNLFSRLFFQVQMGTAMRERTGAMIVNFPFGNPFALRAQLERRVV